MLEIILCNSTLLKWSHYGLWVCILDVTKKKNIKFTSNHIRNKKLMWCMGYSIVVQFVLNITIHRGMQLSAWSIVANTMLPGQYVSLTQNPIHNLQALLQLLYKSWQSTMMQFIASVFLSLNQQVSYYVDILVISSNPRWLFNNDENRKIPGCCFGSLMTLHQENCWL